MDYLKIACSSLVSIVVLFLLAKLIGNRQMSDLTLFDYINGITIGSIAAEAATELESHWTVPLLAMVIYGLVTALISYLSAKFMPVRRLFNGKAIIVYRDGKFDYKGLKRARLDINEFLTECRNAGYFNLKDVKTAIMEQNGSLSILPKPSAKPATTGDLGLTVPDSKVLYNIIIDGKILEKNLSAAGFDKGWLLKAAAKSRVEDLETVMLATMDDTGEVTFYPKFESKDKNDIFG